MSIIKTSNILTFVVDDPVRGFFNLYPLKQKASDLNLTESWHLPKWLDHYSIEYNIVDVDHATPESWYPVGINFWDIDQDYLSMLPDNVIESLSNNQLRLLFSYREADDPKLIRAHIDSMCSKYKIDSRSVILISGNTDAQDISGCIYFWYFDTNYFFQTMSSDLPAISDKKSKKITCLSRTHKHWRECFVYNILRYQQGENYISYGTVKNIDDRDDFILWQTGSLGINEVYPIDVSLPSQTWRNKLPLTADSLTSDQHNNHSIVVTEHYQNSYWNIVLETLLDGSIFITEKTLKPIRNGQPFVIVGCRHSLAYLRDRGYRTFGHVIDESYDEISDTRLRWYRSYLEAKKIMKSSMEDLHQMWEKCLPMIRHNQNHFQRSRKPEIEKLVRVLVNYAP